MANIGNIDNITVRIVNYLVNSGVEPENMRELLANMFKTNSKNHEWNDQFRDDTVDKLIDAKLSVEDFNELTAGELMILYYDLDISGSTMQTIFSINRGKLNYNVNKLKIENRIKRNKLAHFVVKLRQEDVDNVVNLIMQRKQYRDNMEVSKNA